jgi:hypothetical protein
LRIGGGLRFANPPYALRRANLIVVRRDEGDHGIGSVRDELRIIPQRFNRTRPRDVVAIRAHHGKMSGQRLGGVSDGFLERIARGDAAGTSGKLAP